MTKADLVSDVYNNFGLSRSQASTLVDSMFDAIAKALVAGDKVRLPLGILSTRERAARLGRNPATNTQIKIPAKRVVQFSPSRGIKDAVDVRGRKPAAAKAPVRSAKSLTSKAGSRSVAKKTATGVRKSAVQKRTKR